MKRTTKRNGEYERKRIDAAYGLVLGAYDGLLGNERAACRAWSTPAVQQAAMEAAKEFLKKIDDRGNP